MSMSPYNPNTDLTPYQPAGAPDLMSWAMEAGEVYKIAEALARTQFVPAPLRGKPDDICAQILYGRDVKLPPMVALQQIHIIEGRPSLSALSMRGMAQANGVKFRYDEMTDTRCRMAAMAPGDRDWTMVTWTIERAKKLGLTGKSNWTKQPQAMLVARATSELCRLVAAPLFLGMAYSTEELQDGVTDVAPWAETPAAPEPVKRTLKREPVKAQATVGEEKLKPEQKPEAYVADPVTENTRKALMAQFNAAEIKDRDTRLAYVSDLLKREVGSVNEITEAEAKDVLHQLHIDHPFNTKHADEQWPETAEVPA